MAKHHPALQAIAIYWEMLPFCLLIGVPLLVLSHITASPNQQNGLDLLFSWLLVAFLIFLLPEVSIYVTCRSQLSFRQKWRVWKRMWVWGPVRRFFRKYGSNYPKRRRYRKLTLYSCHPMFTICAMYVGLWGKAGFILGLLSGMFLTGLLPTVLVHSYLQNRPRPPPVDIFS